MKYKKLRMFKTIFVGFLVLLLLFVLPSYAESASLPTVQDATPLLPEFRRTQVLANLRKDSSAYDKHIELVKPYVLGKGKMHDTRNLFPGITIPIALYGKDNSKIPNAAKWIEFTRSTLVKHIIGHTENTGPNAGKSLSRNTFRQYTQDLLHSILVLDKWYPQIWQGDDRSRIQNHVEIWAERLSEEHQSKLLFPDSDENTSWFAAVHGQKSNHGGWAMDRVHFV